MRAFKVTLALLIFSAAGAGAEWEVEDRSEAAIIIEWDRGLSLLNPGEPWRAFAIDYPWLLQAEPDLDAEGIVELEEGAAVEVVNGLSRLRTYDTRGSVMTVYDAWLQVRAEGEEGWLPICAVYPNNVSWYEGGPPSAAVVSFTAAFSPLREEPSEKGREIGEEITHEEEWKLEKDVPPGKLYTVSARCGEWLCVGRGLSGAWLPADTPGLEFYYVTFAWSPYDMVDFAFYFPVREDVNRVIYSVWKYFLAPFQHDADPIVTIESGEKEFRICPKELNGYGGAEGGKSYYEVVFPKPIKRESIDSVTFMAGVEADRISVTVDPREAWAEYDEGR